MHGFNHGFKHGISHQTTPRSLKLQAVSSVDHEITTWCRRTGNKASSPGPIIFRQKRTGAQGQEFTVFKFRTMAFETNQCVEQARQGDRRVTGIGLFLRKTSLDEVLQLFNVIRGDMSLVGPRPHAAATQVEGITFEQAVRLYRIRHRVKPGITGLAQIRGQRGETRAISTLEQRLASDLEYIQTWSLWLDITILFRTIPVVLRQTNAW
jgi:lipopolysaccharide/colanic/teichoic acid biosynthesis glycosyltransferase